MIYKICRKCKKIIEYPNTYCSECLEIVNKSRLDMQKQRESNYNKKRDPKYKTFYNSTPWKLLKEKKLQDTNYKCEHCGELAEEVHHIEPIQTESGWLRRLDYSNLESLCIECHNYRHNRFQKRKKVI